MTFKFTPAEIEMMESFIDGMEIENKSHPWISGAAQEVREVTLNGFQWVIKCEIEAIPDQDEEYP